MATAVMLNLPEPPEPYFWRVVETSSGPACLSAQLCYRTGRKGRKVKVWGATYPMEAKHLEYIENHAEGIIRRLADIRRSREIADAVVGDYTRGSRS